MTRPHSSRRATTFAVVSLALGLAVVAVVIRLATAGQIEVRLGADEFRAGRAPRLSASIARDGPTLFQDLLVGGRRDLMVNHVGEDPLSGWYAFEARVPDSDRTCTVRWRADTADFVDPCTGTSYPATGAGLPQYPVTVNTDRDVIVDLTPQGRPGGGTTTAPPSTTVAPSRTVPIIGTTGS